MNASGSRPTPPSSSGTKSCPEGQKIREEGSRGTPRSPRGHPAAAGSSPRSPFRGSTVGRRRRDRSARSHQALASWTPPPSEGPPPCRRVSLGSADRLSAVRASWAVRRTLLDRKCAAVSAQLCKHVRVAFAATSEAWDVGAMALPHGAGKLLHTPRPLNSASLAGVVR